MVATLVVAAVLLGFWLAYRLLTVWLLFFAAVVLATAFAPLVDRLQRLTHSRILAALVVHLAALILLLAVLIAIAPLVVEQTKGLVSGFPQQYSSARQSLLQSEHRLLRELGEGLPPDPFHAQGEPQGGAPLATVPIPDVLSVLSGFVSFFWAVFILFLTFLLSVFWSSEGRRILHTLVMLLPLEQRDEGRQLLADIQAKLGAFVRGQVLLCAMVAGMYLPAYFLIGLPYPVALAVLGGTLEIIPVLGPVIATVPVVLLGLTLGLTVGLEALAANVIIAQIEGYILVPRVMDRSVGVHPFVTLLAITALMSTVGPLGGLLAIPVAAVVQILLGHFVFARTPAQSHVPEQSRGPLGLLLYRAHELLDDLHRQLRSADTERPEFDRMEEEVERLVVDLAATLRRQQREEAAQ